MLQIAVFTFRIDAAAVRCRSSAAWRRTPNL